VVRLRLEDAEQVAARIHHDHPAFITRLPDVGVSGTQFDRTRHTDRVVLRAKIQVDRAGFDLLDRSWISRAGWSSLISSTELLWFGAIR
jgi:hypothetical protein